MFTPFNPLSRHAFDHLWCYPTQDFQYLNKLARITSGLGERGAIILQHKWVPLPDNEKTYMVYMVGQYHPHHHRWYIDYPDQWHLITNLINENQLLAEVYNDHGIQIPRHRVYYRWIDQKNLVFAIERLKNIPVDWENDGVYIRHYDHLKLRTQNYRSINLNKKINNWIRIASLTIKTKEDINLFKRSLYNYTQSSRYQDKRFHEDQLTYWVNGVAREYLEEKDYKVGNHLEWVGDNSIFHVVRYQMSTLPTFDSELDLKRKYLFISEASDHLLTLNHGYRNKSILHFDDQDFFIFDNGNKEGVAYPRYHWDSVRQITNQDYSIVIPYVTGLMTKHNQTNKHSKAKIFDTERTAYVKLIMRVSNDELRREYVFDVDKRHELENLSLTYFRSQGGINKFKKHQLMLGVNSQIAEWRPEHLEKAYYNQVMSLANPDYEVDSLLTKAYGYHGAVKAIGSTYQARVGDNTKFKIPDLYTKLATHLPLDANGVLMAYSDISYPANTSKPYFKPWFVTKHQCSWTPPEGTQATITYLGEGTDWLEFDYNDDLMLIPKGVDYRVYYCPVGKEHLPNEWKDCTKNNPLMYAIIEEEGGSRLQFLHDKLEYTTLVLTDRRFITQHFALQYGSVMKLLLMESDLKASVGSSRFEPKLRAMRVPRGQLDIFLNGRPLVYGIDYIVDFPLVYINTAEYATSFNAKPLTPSNPIPPEQLSTQANVLVMFHGFCTENMELLVPEQVGYVNRWLISRNDYYDIREDKNLLIYVNGQVFPNTYLYSEEVKNSSWLDTLPTPPYIFTKNINPLDLEGRPYQVRDVFVPLKQISERVNDWELREQSYALNKKISDYVKVHELRPDPNDERLTKPMRDYYYLYSPFIQEIINKVKNGIIQVPANLDELIDEELKPLVRDYEYLLDYDPVYQDKYIDHNCVKILPISLINHTIELPMIKVKFINRICRLYMKGKVTTSRHLRGI